MQFSNIYSYVPIQLVMVLTVIHAVKTTYVQDVLVHTSLIMALPLIVRVSFQFYSAGNIIYIKTQRYIKQSCTEIYMKGIAFPL